MRSRKSVDAAVFAEQRLAFGPAHARTGEIDVHHRLAIAKADEERLALDSQRHVARIPPVRAEEQILPVLEAEQGDRLKLSVRSLAEHDRIAAWTLRNSAGNVSANITSSPYAAPRVVMTLQVLVVDVVQQNGVGHALIAA